MGDPAGIEQRLCFVLVPFQNAVTADPPVVPFGILYPIAHVVNGAFFPHHAGNILPEQITDFRRADPLGPPLQKPWNQIALKSKILPHIIRDIVEILLHISQIEIAGIVVLGYRLKQRLHIAAGIVQKALKRRLLCIFLREMLHIHMAALHAGPVPVDPIIFPFVLVHHLVGLSDEFFQLQRFLIGPSMPYRHMALIFFDLLPQLIDFILKLLFSAIGIHRHKFISAGPIDFAVLVPLADQATAMADQPVARFMPLVVIDLFQAADSAINNAHRVHGQFPILLVHGMAVVGPCQLVVIAQVIHPLQQITPPQKGDGKIADHLHKGFDHGHHLFIRIVHADETDGFSLFFDWAHSQTVNALRLQ